MALTQIIRPDSVREVANGSWERLSAAPIPFIARVRSMDEGQRVLMQSHAHTFYFAARFLPREIQGSIVTLYAFCRLLDDVADNATTSAERFTARQTLRAWQSWLRDTSTASPDPSLGEPLAEVIANYHISTLYLLQLLQGLESDLDGVPIQSYAELHNYCYLVASTVGLSMAHILGATSPEALAAAKELGIAMQLTNILRDVGADLTMGRLYLPLDELSSFGCEPDHLLWLWQSGRGPDRAFRELMRFQVARAYHQYERGLEGIPLLPPRIRLSILVAARLYRGILTAIKVRQYDVLRGRATTSALTKGREALLSAATVQFWNVSDHIPLPWGFPYQGS
jgi:phytoene synthase